MYSSYIRPYSVLYAVQFLYSSKQIQSCTLYSFYIHPTIFSPVHCTVPIFNHPYSVLYIAQFIYSTIVRPVHCTVPIFIHKYSVLYTVQFLCSSNYIHTCTLNSFYIHSTIVSPVQFSIFKNIQYISSFNHIQTVYCTIPIFNQTDSVLYTLQFLYSSDHIRTCTLYSLYIQPTIFRPVHFTVTIFNQPYSEMYICTKVHLLGLVSNSLLYFYIKKCRNQIYRN